LTLSATATWVRQNGRISDTQSSPPVELAGKADFWLADAQLSYRLPNRYGAISVGVRNLFDQDVRYFDLDPSNPWLYPERFAYARLELHF
jgi:outer membrane receptor protein involved in Fe transport